MTCVCQNLADVFDDFACCVSSFFLYSTVLNYNLPAVTVLLSLTVSLSIPLSFELMVFCVTALLLCHAFPS